MSYITARRAGCGEDLLAHIDPGLGRLIGDRVPGGWIRGWYSDYIRGACPGSIQKDLTMLTVGRERVADRGSPHYLVSQWRRHLP